MFLVGVPLKYYFMKYMQGHTYIFKYLNFNILIIFKSKFFQSQQIIIHR